MEYNFEIGNVIKGTNSPKNQFKFIIELMGGDADAFFTQEVLVDKDNPYLSRFVEFLNNCKNHYPNGKGGDDDYNEVPDYWLFIDEWADILTPEQMQEVNKCNINMDWESNEEYFGISSFVKYSITYFDVLGLEREVNLKEIA